MQVITSIQNPLIQEARLLQQKKGRNDQKRFLTEGIRCLEMAHSAGYVFPIVFFTEKAAVMERNQDFLSLALQKGSRLVAVHEDVMKRLSQTETNQGLVAVAEMIESPISEIKSDMKILVLDRLQDPGNIGTAIRNAVAFGFDAVVFLSGCGDPWNEKVVRASAGTLFHIRIVIPEQDQEVVSHFLEIKLPLVVSALEDTENINRQLWLKDPLALVIGNEGQGIADWLLRIADHRLKIPMTGPAESLNAGVAAGILMYHMQKETLAQEK